MPSVLDAVEILRVALEGFDPNVLSGGDCATVVEALARIEKRCAAARTRAALRATNCGAHAVRGFADPVDWLARQSGISTGEARTALATAERLDDSSPTGAALLAGELSLAQAAEITRTAEECPGSEDELLDLARRSGLAGLKDRARKIRLDAVDADELHRRQQQAQRLRHWRDSEGMIRLDASFEPVAGVPFANRLDALTDRLVREARQAGRPEPRERLAAVALLQLLAERDDGAGKLPASRAELVLVCDLDAYRRGHTHPGEVCHIIDGGPVPVDVAHDLADRDPFLKAVLHDGKRIDTVTHFGRYQPAHLRTALELGPPPDFDGVVCVHPDCDRRHGLEWDHVNPVANQGPTTFDNLQPRCWPHHAEKTEQDRQAGLLGAKPPATPKSRTKSTSPPAQTRSPGMPPQPPSQTPPAPSQPATQSHDRPSDRSAEPPPPAQLPMQ